MKQKIDMRLQAILVFTFAWLNLLSYMLQVLDFESNKLISIMFYNLIGIYTIFILRSLYYSVTAFYGNVYQYIETPKVFDDYHLVLKNHYEEHSPESYKDLSDNDLNKFIRINLINSTHHNCQLNDKRSQKAFESTKWLVISFLPFLIAFLIFVGFKLDLKHPTKPILIEQTTYQGVNSSDRQVKYTNPASSPDTTSSSSRD
ncbi:MULTISPECIES: hypothetical protein [Vibrio]|uniref:hypothetical protein n=1 Tax=Vibrio TaxID=662 RepID=UPI00148D479B|nr:MULTISPECIES: hypothetical protein [Vibrio]MCT4347641.1 hypothetical protein [Vibrio sp. NC2]NOJ08513.1 hypothetical protein [Vibrio splendidus]